MALMQITDKVLTPTNLDMDGKEYTLKQLEDIVVRKLNEKNKPWTPAVKDVCLDIFKQSLAGKQNFTANKFSLSDKEYNIILKDFGEISGAAYILSTEKKYAAVKFPSGNEKLIDYFMITKEGFEEKFSAKAGQGGKPSVTSVMPVIESFVRKGGLDNKFLPATWVLYHISTEEKNGLYWGPLKAAEYLNTNGYKALTTTLKKSNLKTGYTSNVPNESHLDAAVAACGTFDNFMKEFKSFYDAAGYTATMNRDITKRTIEQARPGKEKRWGALHYPITAEIIRWLNKDENHAKELLTMAANTLTVTQVYLDLKGSGLHYTMKGFSEAEFIFGSPSSVPRPTNNRIGFTMKKTPAPKVK